MRKLNISDDIILKVPINEKLFVIIVIADCVEKDPPNSWDTIRGKLRALDWVNECANIPTKWHSSFILKRLCEYVKKFYCKPPEPSDPLPYKLFLYIIDTLNTLINDNSKNMYLNEIDKFGWEIVKVWFLLSIK